MSDYTKYHSYERMVPNWPIGQIAERSSISRTKHWPSGLSQQQQEGVEQEPDTNNSVSHKPERAHKLQTHTHTHITIVEVYACCLLWVWFTFQQLLQVRRTKNING